MEAKLKLWPSAVIKMCVIDGILLLFIKSTIAWSAFTSDVAMAEVVGIVTKITSSFLEINQVSAKCQQAWMPVQSVKTWCQKSEVSRMQDLDAGCCVFLLGSPSTTPIQVVIRYLWCYTFRLSFQTPCRRRRTSALSKVEEHLVKTEKSIPCILLSSLYNWLNTKFTASSLLSVSNHGRPPWACDQLHKSVPRDKPGKILQILWNIVQLHPDILEIVFLFINIRLQYSSH